MTGSQASVIVEHINAPLQLQSREERQNYGSGVITFWTQCDDTDLLARIWTEVRIPPDNSRLEITTESNNRGCQYFYPHTLKKFAFAAACKGNAEEEIKELSSTDTPTKIFTSALFDTKAQRVYAFKFRLQTTTSSVVAHYLIPILTESD